MSEKKLGFTRYGLKDSAVYYRKIGSNYIFINNPVVETLLEFISGAIFLSFYALFAIGAAVIGVKTMTQDPFNWITLLIGLLLLAVGVKIGYNLFILVRRPLACIGRILVLNNKQWITISLFPIPWLQIIKRSDIKEVTTCLDENWWWGASKEGKKGVYRLKMALHSQSPPKYSNFLTDQLTPQAELKDILLKNKQIASLELASTIPEEIYIESKSYQLNWSTKQLFSPWEEVFKMIGGGMILFLITYFWFYHSMLAWAICGIFLISFFFRILYEIQAIWHVKEVCITPFLIKQIKTRTPFIKDYTIKKQDIALLSPIAVEHNQYAIQIISQEGDIHQLPIHFESEEKAQEQLEAMKNMLGLSRL